MSLTSSSVTTNGINGTNGTIFKPVTHVIFDMDGLLLDSEKCYHELDESIVAKYGKKYPDGLKEMIRGFTDLDCARKIIEVCGLPITPEEYDQEFNSFLYLLQDCKLMPGAERLIRHLAKHNIPMGIATSSSHESVQNKIKNHREVFDLIPHMVMGSSDPEVIKGKPHPDVFLVCAKRFPGNPEPEKCLVFEDAPSGVTAANKAGMQVVWVPYGDVKCTEDNATYVIKSLLDFVPEKFGLPPF
ncbi:probable pseudouridine-5'-phosphatase [Planococcus citri]|uniref:probable pseudouridine-5'-phosphatase n=1 Tax=Planococcus citri TaxID=170843 RepID=UPI0031F86A62